MQPDWIAVDWGTTRLRVWAMSGAQPVAARASDKGMGGLTPEGFEPALLELIADWLPDRGQMPVIACGMVGARTGWAEAEYRATPCTPLDPHRATRPPVRDARLDPRILPGLSQAEPADVMRGEETQIAGFLAAQPDFDGTLCLPGTHCKWVAIRAGRVERFQTFMTGELFSLISRQSVLRLTIGDAATDDEAFAAAASRAMADPNAAHAGLFALRAGALLHDLGAEKAAGALSGLLIGAELGAARDFWHDRTTIVIGAPALARLYETPLRAAGADAAHLDGGELVLAGLTAARTALQEKP
ncbi:2-dehydro-3-deoxygalactonokinase [Paracoccus halophilus]|uniref:2-dehydro-3-deoxygalactonokinase n=1 Tax=Paracoccus halophilus TaxID=376733 RepID=A0A099F7Z1_9RHOB|nr:2-dehydro-3-deoxygalactonokinase [Paracoccus halophilus]KGJ06825.1 2-keto-3-deoxy-galactonokinase [Paracoccus halophilus]SFA41302.1 2-dehydro-3-deoxygalactonokinase [Paracoccus halophilus]